MHEIAKFPAGPNLVSSSPLSYNMFGYARELLDPNAKFVSPNNDMLYLIAVCDVRNGPLVLHVPDTHDRYYVLQFVDAWTNNFVYIRRPYARFEIWRGRFADALSAKRFAGRR